LRTAPYPQPAEALSRQCHVTPRSPGGSEPAMPDELAELVTAAKDGDRSAFDALVRATYADAYTLAYRLTGNEEDARDVVQDAYLRAYKGLKRFREEAQFTTWLYRITANCASTTLARRTKNSHEDLDDEGAGGGGPPRRLRPAPRGHRRRTGDHRGGGQGQAPPGAEEVAGAAVPDAG